VSGGRKLTRKVPGAKRATKAAAPKAASAKPARPKAKAAKIKQEAPAPEETVLSRVLKSLDDDKAEDIVTIEMDGRSSLCDAIVIATGRSSRHVASIAEHLARKLKDAGYGTRPVDGVKQGDWALVDAGDVIVHIFRPEVRTYYDLEGMWSVGEPARHAAR
jgi:ribosome-associated protein